MKSYDDHEAQKKCRLKWLFIQFLSLSDLPNVLRRRAEG